MHCKKLYDKKVFYYCLQTDTKVTINGLQKLQQIILEISFLNINTTAFNSYCLQLIASLSVLKFQQQLPFIGKTICTMARRTRPRFMHPPLHGCRMAARNIRQKRCLFRLHLKPPTLGTSAANMPFWPQKVPVRSVTSQAQHRTAREKGTSVRSPAHTEKSLETRHCHAPSARPSCWKCPIRHLMLPAMLTLGGGKFTVTPLSSCLFLHQSKTARAFAKNAWEH